MLADFGFTRITNSVKEATAGTRTVFFMAPELLLPTKFSLEKGFPSKELRCVCFRDGGVPGVDGPVPFHPKREFEVIQAVVEGERPPKPKNAEEIGMTEAIWELMTECWKENRAERPVMPEILRRFRKITGGRKATGSAAEFGIPRLGVPGNRSPKVSEDPSSTNFAYECRSLTLVVIGHLTHRCSFA